MTLQSVKAQLLLEPTLVGHAHAEHLIEIVTGKTYISSAGFPYISDKSFRIFTDKLPHLFAEGQAILDWLESLRKVLGTLAELSQAARASLERSIQVLRTAVFTAGVTAPPDLWILRQVLGAHKRTLDRLLEGHAIAPEDYAERHGLNCQRLKCDLHLLHARGYLHQGDDDFWAPGNPAVVKALEQIRPLPESYRINWVPRLLEGLSRTNDAGNEDLLRQWLTFEVQHDSTGTWVAGLFQLELGYRLLPLVLALRVLEFTAALKQGERPDEVVPRWLPEMESLLEAAGWVCEGTVTQLGARVFERGPGPFGIIAAYHHYLNHLEALLNKDQAVKTWVQRGENVAASQDANRRTFQMANDNLDDFCEQYGFRYTVFIEHAVGQGEAIHQRFERDGEARVYYFGADLEPKAIEQARAQQRQGSLPQNLEFICPADIGEPHRVIDYLDKKGRMGEPTVMMVGNGFHEIRNQSNDKMIEVFRAYCEAGFVLIFTEESALSDEALLHTAWNTYHAGFRYVHELSGQGLRPARGVGARSDKWSWHHCASLAGYLVLDEFSYRSRTIYPYERPQNKNPSISETFFCVPYRLAIDLGVKTE